MAIGAALGAAFGAAADIAGESIKSKQRVDERSQIMALEEARDRRAAEYKQRLDLDTEEIKFKRGEDRRRAQAGEIEQEAGLLAAASGKDRISEARKIYEREGLGNDPAVKGALDEAEKRESSVTLKHIQRARVNKGYDKPDQAIDDERQDKAQEITAADKERAARLTDAQIKNYEDDNKRADRVASRAEGKEAESKKNKEKLLKLQKRYAMFKNDPAAASMADATLAEIRALGGDVDGGKKDLKRYQPIKEKDDLGNEQITGAFDTVTGKRVALDTDDKPVNRLKQFEAGKIYKDAKGNRAKYLGGDRWQPL